MKHDSSLHKKQKNEANLKKIKRFQHTTCIHVFHIPCNACSNAMALTLKKKNVFQVVLAQAKMLKN
jgi:hypothetical protein